MLNIQNQAMRWQGGQFVPAADGAEVVVSATCEMVITCIPGRVDRRRDEAIGLNLLQF